MSDKYANLSTGGLISNYTSGQIDVDQVRGAVRKYSMTVGNWADHEFVVTHNLNTTEVVVQVFRLRDLVDVTPQLTIIPFNRNTLIVGFPGTPPTNSYTVVVLG